jgi:hypothetical protein
MRAWNITLNDVLLDKIYFSCHLEAAEVKALLLDDIRYNNPDIVVILSIPE